MVERRLGENGLSGVLFFLDNRKRHYFLSFFFFVRAVKLLFIWVCFFFAFVWPDPEHRVAHTRTCTRWGHTIVVFDPSGSGAQRHKKKKNTTCTTTTTITPIYFTPVCPIVDTLTY